LGFAGTAEENAGENHEIRNYLLMLDDITIEACTNCSWIPFMAGN
jgi:hypothetical protein